MRFNDNDNYGFLLYQDALNDMFSFHKGQVDKCGEPYYLHPLRIAAHFQELNDADAAIVACLHDLVEDTSCSLVYLEDRYPESIVDAVDAITRRENETYKSYMRRMVKNDIARRVKRQDILDNLRPERVWKDAPYSRYYWGLALIDGTDRGIREQF